MTSIVPFVTGDTEIISGMSSADLYALEQAGQIARDILDGRIAGWVEAGWTQQSISAETGIPQQTLSDRVRRLGLSTASLRGRPRKIEQPADELPAPVIPSAREAANALLTSEDFADVDDGPISGEVLDASPAPGERRRLRKAREIWLEVGARLDELEDTAGSRWSRREETIAAGILIRRLIVVVDELKAGYE